MYKGKERIQMSKLMAMVVMKMTMTMMVMVITSIVSPWRTVQGGPSKASHLEWNYACAGSVISQ